MRKAIAILLAMITIFSCGTTAMAAETTSTKVSENLLIAQEDFILKAEINETILPDGEIQFELTRTEPVSKLQRTSEIQYKQDKATIIAFDKDDAEEIREGLARAQTDKTTSDWKLGNSLYMEVALKYSSTPASGGGEYYRINSFTVKASVNSGTTLTGRSVSYSCVGVNENGGNEYTVQSLNITNYANPYTSAVMNSLPAVAYAYGGALGVTFYCTAARPSGASNTYSLTNNVY